jgi:hypothetical protein
MNLAIVLPGLTSLLAALFAIALLDQWRERRRAYQLVWGIGMAFFAIAAGCETVGAAVGWNEPLYRTWYLTGAVWTAGWLGLGTGFLLGRTRFGYTFALCIFLAGLFTLLAARRLPEAEVGDTPLLYFIVAGVLALAVAIETYFQNERWPYMAAGGVLGATLISLALMLTITLPSPGYAVDPATDIPTATIIPASLRLLTPFLNITGGLALILGAVFSAYVFMPKRRVLDYSLDPGQPGDHFLFNLFIAPVAIAVNFLASLPGALSALVRGRIHSRVRATLLIAVGAIVASSTDTLHRFGSTDLFQIGKFVGVLLLFGGFLISVEVFREIRIPFTSLTLRRRRQDRDMESGAGPERISA